MNCPNCRCELPSERAAVCPSCGYPLPPLLATPAGETSPRSSALWIFFFFALLLPPLLTILTVSTGKHGNDAAAPVALVAGGIGGIVCGALLGRRLGKSPEGQVALGFVMAGVMAAVCIGFCFFGCMAGGFKMDFR